MNPNAPLYVVFLLLHAASAVLGFGSVAIGGLYLPKLARKEEEGIAFFRQGRALSKVVIPLTLALGVTLMFLAGPNSNFYSHLWFQGAVTSYLIAYGLCLIGIWPKEALIRRALFDDEKIDAKTLVGIQKAIVGVELLVVVAFVLMVSQPG
ncbi:MAG: hypothetical protein M0019_05865 [Actinomycetota bacterium]|nr:hypothetical protein [Actinomycetota bacterium]